LTLGKDIVIEKLRAAVRGALKEVKSDPDFAPKVLNTICTELGMDTMAAMYLSSKLKNIIKEKAAEDAS
jgi:hypothetical protein